MNSFSRLGRTSFALAAVFCSTAMAAPTANAQTVRTKTMMRIFWQDRDTDQLSWADITATDKWNMKRGWIEGFPKLDAEKQDLVQMQHNNGMLVVGVRDHDDGQFQSGWVSIDTGVFEEPHGNHTHWKYTRTPKITGMKLDTNQGNPAHLYVYDNNFYLANDQKKVFFAPADGVCWVSADLSLQKTAETVQINHLSLGQNEEAAKPLRTGAFTNERNWVLCTTGQGDQATLCLINAQSTQPTVVKLKIPAADGLRLTTPETVLSLGKRYALLFQDRTDEDSEVPEQLTVVELDPNRDRDFSDARSETMIPVGASKIDGHHGHHAMAFDAYGRHAVFTEPGPGILNVFSLKDMKVVARFKVGGSPDSIVAVGAPEHFH